MQLHVRHLAVPWLFVSWVPLAHAEPMTFGRTLDLAEKHSPVLRAGAASVRSAEYESISAGRLPDPKVFLGVDNYPVSGPMRGSLEGDFMTMQKIGVMQEVPNASKRLAQVAAAAANVGVAQASQDIARWKIRLSAAQAWLARYYLERKLEMFEQLATENTAFSGVLRAQTAAGRGDAADAIEQQLEQAQVEDRRDEVRRDLAKATATLRSFVGQEADQPIAGGVPDLQLDVPALKSRLDSHPELQALSAQQAAAQAELDGAAADKRPDWGVELAYAKRGPQFGNMVSIQFTVALPVFGEKRQDPIVASKAELRSRVDADREAMRRERARELDADLAEREALGRQLERIRTRALPLADQRIDLQTAGYAAGKSTLAAIFSARRDRLDENLKAIDLQGQLDAVTAKLYFTYGADAK